MMDDYILREEKRLCQKYSVSSIDEVLEIQDKMLRGEYKPIDYKLAPKGVQKG